MEVLKITQQGALKAYAEGNDEVKKVLINFFGKDTFVKAANVIERITCIEDVFTEIKESYADFKEKHNHLSKRKYAAELLEKITKAYNEGWVPDFTINQYKWFPVFKTGSGFVFSFFLHLQLRLFGRRLGPSF